MFEGELLLDAHKHLPGTRGVRGHGEALEHLIRVAPQDRPILEGSGLALGGIAHDELDRGVVGSEARPFDAGGEPGAAPTPQSRRPDLGDHAIAAQPVRTFHRGATATVGVFLEAADRCGGKDVCHTENVAHDLGPGSSMDTTGSRWATFRKAADPRKVNIMVDDTATSPPELARHLFAPIAPTYERWARLLSMGQDARWRRVMVDGLGLSPGSRVLDVAAGTGSITRLMESRGLDVIAVDQSPEMTRHGEATRRYCGPGDGGATAVC